MADLVTHLCSALLPAALTGTRWAHVGPIAIGTVLPDVVARVPPLILEEVHRRGVPVLDVLVLPWGVLHEPAACAATCVLMSYLFAERVRRQVLLGLVVGCALHIGLDVFQYHHGQGYRLLFPLSLMQFEVGWIESEGTVGWAVPLGACTVGAWCARACLGRWSRGDEVD